MPAPDPAPVAAIPVIPQRDDPTAAPDGAAAIGASVDGAPVDLMVVTATRRVAPDLTGPAGCGYPILVAAVPGVEIDRGSATVPVRVVVLREDLGRPAALGRAVTELPDTVDWVLLCDPAARPGPDALAALRATARVRPRAGLLGAALHTPAGVVLPSSGRLPTRTDLLTGRALVGPAGDPGWVSTACALVRRAAWESVGGFDPRYLGCGPPRVGDGPDPADVDLADRMQRAGWLVRPVPAATVEVADVARTDDPDGVGRPAGIEVRDPPAGGSDDPGILEPASDGWTRYGRDRYGVAGGLVLATAGRLRRRRS